MTTAGYIGRFAPSPTGPLHMGSLVAALGSYLDARHYRGQWLLRIEDLDPPRTRAGVAESMLADLSAHGLHWDGPICWQSRRTAAYRSAIELLNHRGHTFHCTCSRSEIGSGAYPGTCRSQTHPIPNSAVRARVPAGSIACADLLYGDISLDVSAQPGDFVLRRRDGLYAYQLAVVVDDAAAGVTDVVRGADLLDNTPRQILLQQWLELPTPRYLHLPLVLTASGEKLSKQTFAPPLRGRPQENLLVALQLLGQNADARLADGSCMDLLESATRSWQRGSIPRMLRPLAG